MTPSPMLIDAAPAPVAVAMAKPQIAPLPQKPASPKMDWADWKTFILESPSRPNSGRGDDSRIPGSGALRLSGNNTGMSGGYDECVFYARQIGGDWTLIARVSANDGPAGIVARESIGSDRPCVGIFLGADGKLNSVLRTEPAGKLPHYGFNRQTQRRDRTGTTSVASIRCRGAPLSRRPWLEVPDPCMRLPVSRRRLHLTPPPAAPDPPPSRRS